MSKKTHFHIFTSNHLIDFIEATGESINIDAKGPMQWDGGEVSAGLTKDIIAFANSRDGGVIVIGKEEPSTGRFVLTGLTDAQADSFDTTKVATWVNNHCTPPVNLVCNRVEHKGLEFIVMTVDEFSDVPVLCTKQYEVPIPPEKQKDKKKQKVILKKGEIYVRSANAASTPLTSIEELRTLIGRVTVKRADEMLGMIQLMMKGQPFYEPKQEIDPFLTERKIVSESLTDELEGKVSSGAWTLVCHPVSHNPTRWDESNEMKDIVTNGVVNLRKSFPPVNREMHVRDWGICNQAFGDAFGFTRSGFFMAMRLFRENSVVFKNPWQPNPDIPAGEWLDFKYNIGIIIEFYMFLSRLVEEYEVGEEIYVELVAEPLTGRRMASMDANTHFDPTEPCRSTKFRYKNVFKIESLRANWEEPCIKALCRFLELFITNEFLELERIMSRAVDSFKHRRF
ncbi:ATP-binding protein [Gimesia maris]|uniref:AlbA family DNA-binding domain-containing protein n=1 Tax=Gimesia maris TaxID=122 RepID=UPI0030D7A10D